MSKPRVYFDVTADGKSLGRIVMEVNSSPCGVPMNFFLNFVDLVIYMVSYYFNSSVQMLCQRLLVSVVL